MVLSCNDKIEPPVLSDVMVGKFAVTMKPKRI